MHQGVPSHLRRSSRGIAFAVALGVLAALPPAASFAGVPVVAKPTATPVESFSATVTAEVTSNGGTPPIYDRGFVFSRTSLNSDPLISGINVTTIDVPGTLGTMTRTLTGLIPGHGYSVKAYADNSAGRTYSEIRTFNAACPAIFLRPLPNSYLGENYSYPTQALGGSGYAWTPTFGYAVTDGALPPGLVLDQPSGTLGGVPTLVGSFGFTVTYLDSYWNCGASRAYSLTITAVEVNPGKLDFAAELVGSPSAPKTVTITNYSGGPVALAMPFAFTGPFSEGAPTSTPCADPLPSPGYCTVDVVFMPPPLPLPPTDHVGSMAIGPVTVSLRGKAATALVPQVYVSNSGADTVSVIDPATNVVRAVVTVGSEPRNLAALPGGGKVYVPNRYGNSVSVISTATNTWLKTISDGSFVEPYAVAPTPLGDEVWVVNRASTDITVIDTTTVPDTVAGVVDGEACIWNPEGIVANPRTHEMYVISRGSASVCVFDRVTRLLTREIYVGGDPRYGVVLPDGSALYVDSGYDGSNGSSGVARVALPSGTVTYIQGADGQNMDMKADGSKIYIARQGNGFGFINTVTNTFTSIPLADYSSPHGVAVHDAAGRVYVSDEDQEVVYVVDLATDTELPNPELPIQDPRFNYPSAMASIKVAAPVGPFTPPTVATLGATAGSVTATVNGNVIANGGMPIFERGFAYSDTDFTPEPGEPNVSIVVVSGGVGAMSGTLPNLFTDATYRYQAYAKNLSGTGLGGVASFSTTGTCTEISISPSSMPNGILGVDYSPILFTASGGGPYTFSYVGLPPGLTGSSTGAVSGTPTTTGSYPVEVVATEALTGCWASVKATVVIGSPVSAGSVVISEFRTRGPGEPLFEIAGGEDEYVEIGNRTSADIVVASTDGSGGWSIGRPGEVVALIPDGTVIKKGGHWLATGYDFSLYYYGAPEEVWYGDEDLWIDLPDDTGIALFTTADSGNYTALTRLDAVGGAKEADPLFFEGTPLVEVVQAGPTDPEFQTAWVRRVDNSGILSDTGDNDRDFIFVATDAGLAYGPLGDVKAVLGGPGPEDSDTVHDVLQSEFTASLLDPSQGQDRTPNRQVEPYEWVDYRRVFKNNTGKDITALAFKVINVTTLNSRKTLAVQAALTPATAPPVQLEVPPGSNNFVDMLGTNLDYDGMYPVTAYSETRSYYCGESCVVAPPACDYIIDGYCYYTFFHKAGGINSRLIVPFGGRFGPPQGLSELKGPIGSTLPPGESVGVNFRAGISSRGYYLWVILPQISFEPLSCNCEQDAVAGVKPRRERRDRTATRPAARKR